jgi:hypothetical protein
MPLACVLGSASRTKGLRFVPVRREPLVPARRARNGAPWASAAGESTTRTPATTEEGDPRAQQDLVTTHNPHPPPTKETHMRNKTW